MTFLKTLIKGSSIEQHARFFNRFWNSDTYERSHSKLNTKKILLACFPKSGSTFVRSVIDKKKEFKHVNLVPSYYEREHELDIRFLYKYRKLNYIAQLHVRANNETEKLVKQFDLIPVILVRDIYDVIVSLVDNMRRNNAIRWPMAKIFDTHLNLTDEELYSVVVDLFVPWYINFFVGWKISPLTKIIVNYEEMLKNELSFFKKIFSACEMVFSDEEIRNMIDETKKNSKHNKLNKGVVGRGNQIPVETKNKIVKLCSYYPNIDFSEIGILSNKR